MNAEEKVLQAEREWLEAHLAGDVAALGRLMHADHIQIRPDGSMWDKQRVLASFEGGGRHWDRAEADELQVKVYGETALVVGRWRAEGVNQGEAFDYAARYVSVWVLEEGNWLMVSDNATEIK